MLLGKTASTNDTELLVSAEPDPRLGQIVGEIARTAVPNILGYGLTLVNELTNTVILGRTGDPAALAAMGLSNLMLNCLANTIGIGMAGALDTLVSQAHGAGQQDIASHHFQRCRVLVALQMLWMVPVLYFSDDILIGIGQDAEVAARAGEYIRASLWGLFAFFQYEATRKYLQNREDAIFPAIICAVGATMHVGWCWFFVIGLGLGNAGAGYANCVTWWTQCAMATLYLACSAKNAGLRVRSVVWVEAPGMSNWGDYMRLAIPATLQLCSEAWFWEICVLVVGYLGKVALAAHVTTLNWVTLSTTASLGINASTATLVGTALGANLPRKAKATAWMCMCTNMCIWSGLAFVMVYDREALSEFYSSDVYVQRLMQQLLPIFAVVGFCDSMQTALSGALRGIGRHSVAAATYLLAYYGVMLPGGIVAAFNMEMGIHGVWGSFGAGTGLAAIVFVVLLLQVDYPQVAAETSARIELESMAASECGSPSVSRVQSCDLKAARRAMEEGMEEAPEFELQDDNLA